MSLSRKEQCVDDYENNADHEDNEVQEDVRQDGTNAADGDCVEADEGLIIVRQPKQSDADIATGEVSTVKF